MSKWLRSMAGLVIAVVSVGMISLGSIQPVQAATPHSTESTLSLSVGIGADTAVYMDMYYAEYEKIFKNVEHLNLTVINEGASVLTDVAGGKIDLGGGGVTAPMTGDLEGIPMQALYAPLNGSSTGAIIVPVGSPYTSLMSLAGQRVVEIGVANAAYGGAVAFSSYIVSKGGAPLTIVSAATAANAVALLASGGAAAFIGVAETFTSAIAAGQDNLILAGNSKLATSILGGADVDSLAFYGTTAGIKAHKPAIERFLAGLALADKVIRKPALLATEAAALNAVPTFSGESTSSLETSIGYESPYWTTVDGDITPTSWADTIATTNTYGLSINVAKPALDYAHFVNMSLYNAGKAVPTKPGKVKATANKGTLRVSWKASSAVTPVTKYAAVAEPSGKSCTTSGKTSCTIKGLTLGTTYVVHVTATNAFGVSKAGLSAK